MYPLQRRHQPLLRPSASYPGGVPMPPTSRMLAPESEGHYLPPQSPLLSQPYSFTPSTLRSEAEFARLERSNRELKLALERVEKADRWQRLQSEFRDISSSSSGAAVPLSQPLFYPFCSPSAAPAASPSRLGDSLGRSPFGTQQQQHQRRQSWRSYQDHQHTYLDHEQEYDGDDDDGDSTPPLSGRAKKQRLEDPPGVTRDLAIVNLDHVRFQHEGQVHHAMMRSRGVVTDLYKDTPFIPSMGGVSSSNNNSTHIQPILPISSCDASETARTRPLDPSLYFADSVFFTPNRSGSSSPALAFVAPPNLKRARGAQQPSQRPTKLASLIDASTLPQLLEQGEDMMNNTVTSNSSAPSGRPRPYRRMHHQHAHQPQETSSVNPKDLMNGAQYKCAPPTASTTPSPFLSKIRAISATSNKITPSNTTAFKAPIASSEPNATFVIKKAKAHVNLLHYEQERARAKMKTDRLVLKFKAPLTSTNGSSSNRTFLKDSKAIKTEDPQTTSPHPNTRFRRSTTATPTPKSELEPKQEPEENSRDQVHESEQLTERWVVDAVVIPIPRWYRDSTRD